MVDADWSNRQIVRALFLDEDKVGRHLKEYLAQCQLRDVSGGSPSKLNEQQSQGLIAHLKTNTYANAHKVIQHVL